MSTLPHSRLTQTETQQISIDKTQDGSRDNTQRVVSFRILDNILWYKMSNLIVAECNKVYRDNQKLKTLILHIDVQSTYFVKHITIFALYDKLNL